MTGAMSEAAAFQARLGAMPGGPAVRPERCWRL